MTAHTSHLGARYRSIDEGQTILNLGEIDDTETFKDQSYTVLGEEEKCNCETGVRTYEAIREVGEVSMRRTKLERLEVGNPSQY
jgi:hypothetical protein